MVDLLEEVIDRVKVYKEVGVDVIFILGLLLLKLICVFVEKLLFLVNVMRMDGMFLNEDL